MKDFIIKRLSHKAWWLSFISSLCLLLSYFGIDLTKYIGTNWQSLLNIIFTMLTLLGISVDTSTEGFGDRVE